MLQRVVLSFCGQNSVNLELYAHMRSSVFSAANLASLNVSSPSLNYDRSFTAAAVQKNTVKPAAIEIDVRVYYNDYGNHRNNTEETRF